MEATIERVMPHSIELTRNAKGDYQWSIKIYWEENGLTEALVTLKTIDETLRLQYLTGKEM